MAETSTHHHRRSIRLNGFDYTQARAYFITLCCQDRVCLFGECADGEIQLNPHGEIVTAEWLRTSTIRPEVQLDTFVVMPNHFHAIVIMGDAEAVGAHSRAPLPNRALTRPPRSLGALVAGFKAATTKQINQYRDTPGQKVWQRNYYEHIIRNDDDLNRHRMYIENNPGRWAEDRENPATQLGETASPSIFAGE